jgi:hypothetical protein
MNGRVMFAGPAGAGKTWTALSFGTHLDATDRRGLLVIDTEKESALTYADVFRFEHLPWRPPYNPEELTDVLGQLGDRYGVVIIDSLSHFWRGIGGTLDQAGAKIQGWKAARPMQERLVEAILAMPCHVLLCVRSKMGYLINEGGPGGRTTVEQVGMEPMQDDVLPYEVNICFDIDKAHNLQVTKSRTTAVPVGRMYPAGAERHAAAEYAEWLAGGIPPASRDDVERIVATFANVVDADERKHLKAEFVQVFGQPYAMVADRVPEALAWLAEHVPGGEDAPIAPPARPEGPTAAPSAPALPLAEADAATGAPAEPEPPAAEIGPDAAPLAEPGHGADHVEGCALPSGHPGPCRDADGAPIRPALLFPDVDAVEAYVKGLDKRAVVLALTERELPTNGNEATLRLRLARELATNHLAA